MKLSPVSHRSVTLAPALHCATTAAIASTYRNTHESFPSMEPGDISRQGSLRVIRHRRIAATTPELVQPTASFRIIQITIYFYRITPSRYRGTTAATCSRRHRAECPKHNSIKERTIHDFSSSLIFCNDIRVIKSLIKALQYTDTTFESKSCHASFNPPIFTHITSETHRSTTDYYTLSYYIPLDRIQTRTW